MKSLRGRSAGMLLVTGCLLAGLSGQSGGDRRGDTPYGEQLIKAYFQQQVNQIATHCLQDVKTLEDWTSRRDALRRQLFEMLGLWPIPQKSELRVTITGQIDHGDFIVEKLYYQSLPGLYVTANLYRPKQLGEPLPAVLYLCGHGNVKKNGISYGSKASYQHHPAWFARNGFVSLVLDTLQLGEIEGEHHGTYRKGLWWWFPRGYTPAGVEAWNAIRALDYLQTRPEVDPNRLGVTGRSGGGAYSWWLAALDERIKVAVPVAGITDLQNHVVDGAIEGHCDCMYMLNSYRWDFPLVAALVAPRPLLIANSDKDRIFPLDGVLRVHEKLRRIYRLYGAEDRLGLLITEGPHKDTQDLQVPSFLWMNRWLKEKDLLIDKPAIKMFEPEDLKVFERLPADQLNTQIDERFVSLAPEPKVPTDPAAWAQMRRQWMKQLSEQCFRGWPENQEPFATRKIIELTAHGLHLSVHTFNSEQGLPLRLWMLRDARIQRPKLVTLRVLDQPGWEEWVGKAAAAFGDRVGEIIGPGLDAIPSSSVVSSKALLGTSVQNYAAIAMIAPRGIGPTAWPPKKEAHILRRFALLGQTLDGMRVWDVRRALGLVQTLPEIKGASLRLEGRGPMAGIALYASLFETGTAELDLWSPPITHREGPIFLNVLKVMDMPQALAMALPNCKVIVYDTEPNAWAWPRNLVEKLKLGESALQFRSHKP